jgi:hypothetical protein
MTKSGKTVLVSKVCPQNKSVWFDGGSYENEEDFWADICGQLDVFQTITKGTTFKSGTIGESQVTVGSGLFAGLMAKVGAFLHRETSSVETRRVSSKSKAIVTLRVRRIPLIIDDFHYIDTIHQKKILRALKALVFQKLPVILISIPHRKNDALKAERELTGRTVNLPIPNWNVDELLEIAALGFPKLNVNADASALRVIAGEANGSPHLMQEFCLGLCRQNKVNFTEQSLRRIDASGYPVLFSEISESSGRPVFERLKQGPRSRTDRKPRTLANGEKTDIYGLVLFTLMQMKPGLEQISYDQLRAAIKESSKTDPPQMQEISRVLDHMSKISVDDNASAPVLDWEKEGRLHITDPFFSFFLKWGKFKE